MRTSCKQQNGSVEKKEIDSSFFCDSGRRFFTPFCYDYLLCKIKFLLLFWSKQTHNITGYDVFCSETLDPNAQPIGYLRALLQRTPSCVSVTYIIKRTQKSDIFHFSILMRDTLLQIQ